MNQELSTTINAQNSCVIVTTSKKVSCTSISIANLRASRIKVSCFIDINVRSLFCQNCSFEHPPIKTHIVKNMVSRELSWSRRILVVILTLLSLLLRPISLFLAQIMRGRPKRSNHSQQPSTALQSC